MMTSPPLSIALDRDGEEPIYRQLIRQIQAQIESGELPAGTRLPASRDLARKLKISRISVVNAYAELRAANYLSAHAGRGTFVAKEKGLDYDRGLGGNNPLRRDTHIVPDRSIRDMMKLASKPGVINFSHGAPPPEFYPAQYLRDAMNTVLDRDGALALSYEMAEGYMPLRIAVRDYVSSHGIQCRADNVLVTGGAQQGLDLVMQSMLSEGDTLVTANPTYLGILDIARARRVRVHGIEANEEGIRLDMLENYLMDNSPQLIYVMPSFQNPTGHVMPLHRRRQLLNLSNRYGVPIIEDAVYEEFRFEGDDLPPLKALDESGTVIYVGGFTKMLLPGMRIGYVIAGNRYYERLVRIKEAADISTSGLNQRAIHLLLKRGILPQQLNRNNRELRRRRNAALRAAEEYFPPGARWRVPEGGLYLWVELPEQGPTASELFIAAVQVDVAFAIGNIYFTNGSGSYNLRLNYSLQTPDMIVEGFKRLGKAWRELAGDYATLEKESSPLF